MGVYKIEFCWLLVYNEEKRRQFNPDCDSHYARFILSFSFYKYDQAPPLLSFTFFFGHPVSVRCRLFLWEIFEERVTCKI